MAPIPPLTESLIEPLARLLGACTTEEAYLFPSQFAWHPERR